MVIFAFAVSLVPAAGAAVTLQEGTVVKAKGFPSLYYINADGQRLVFPNANIYYSWYDNFSNVAEVNASDLAPYLITGNVQYRPGVLLIKIQSDPKVYAVSQQGVIRWVSTEALAQKLYGSHWTGLVDDVPVSLFINYKVGPPITNENDFQPEGEEQTVATINENLRPKVVVKLPNITTCKRIENWVNKMQKRLQRIGINGKIVLGEEAKDCINIPGTTTETATSTPPLPPAGGEKQTTICHIPPGNPAARQTITVGTPAVKAHLKHGDSLGPCSGGTETDTQAPTITGVTASSTLPTLVTITWTTNENSTSVVVYGTQSLSATTTTQTVSDSALVLAHSVGLTGLTASTTYYFRVESKDASNNLATSTEMTFTTPAAVVADTTPPVISAMVTTPHATTTDITWTTDEPSTTKVIYATQTLATATTTESVTDTTLVTSHQATLSNLTTSTPYFFRVESKDASNNTASSTEQTFTTTS